MTLTEILTIIAIVIGPIAAVQIEKIVERIRETKARKNDIFKTLMATRGTVLSVWHVEALNRIDLEFSHSPKYRKVIEAWKELFDNLTQGYAANEQLELWSEKNKELRSNLLYEMGKSLGYEFDKVLIKRNIYSPIAHENIEKEQESIRKGILQILNGERNIPISFNNNDQDQEAADNFSMLLSEMITYYRSQNDNAENKT